MKCKHHNISMVLFTDLQYIVLSFCNQVTFSAIIVFVNVKTSIFQPFIITFLPCLSRMSVGDKTRDPSICSPTKVTSRLTAVSSRPSSITRIICPCCLYSRKLNKVLPGYELFRALASSFGVSMSCDRNQAILKMNKILICEILLWKNCFLGQTL